MTTIIIIALVSFFVGCAITFIYNKLTMNNFTTSQENKYEQFTNRINDKYTQFTDQLGDTHKQFAEQLNGRYQNLTNELDRLTETEANAIYLKQAAYILFVHKKENRNKYASLVELEKLVTTEYIYGEAAEFETFNDWEKEHYFQAVLKAKTPLRVILMNDDFFEEFETERRGHKLYFIDEHEAILKPFFETLKRERIGFINIGRTQLHQFYPKEENHYVGFTNNAYSAYSAYSNINNLLKYMMYAKNIKPPQKRKF